MKLRIYYIRLLSLLAQYDYPNIKKDIISSFCEQLICWIESLTPQSIEEDLDLIEHMG